jgi:methylenetetrahydrofolate dehydrogenase (NADP+)/methenyltetrahydrofolate cyclohydrolase
MAEAPRPARVLDGKEIAAKVRREVTVEVARFVEKHGRPPSLHVVLAGEDAASSVYVRNKERAAKEVGMAGEVHRLPADIAHDELLARVRALAADDGIDGILVQLPLPKGIREQEILDAVPFEKDVDGFHPMNAGMLASGRPALVPCTPLGCIRLLDEAAAMLKADGVPFSIEGANAVVVGRSNIVGKPVAQLLLQRSCTVTMAHSKTRDLPGLCRTADVLVVAIGRAEMVKGDWVKPGAVVIDVGINRVDAGGGKTKLVGDVEYAPAAERAAAITPVPGGVGPMTIALLLQNTLRAAELRLAAR